MLEIKQQQRHLLCSSELVTMDGTFVKINTLNYFIWRSRGNVVFYFKKYSGYYN